MFVRLSSLRYVLFFFFNDTATTEIYTLSLHDALPISASVGLGGVVGPNMTFIPVISIADKAGLLLDRKSTRLNSSYQIISYAVFFLKKKNGKSSASSSFPASPTSDAIDGL